MTREILFKAKRKDNNEWVYGYLVEYTFKDTIYMDGTLPKQSYIFPMDERSQLKSLEKRIEVIPETICQYTGLDDKNGNKIFENDFLKPPLFLDDEQRPCLCIYNQENNANEIIGFGLYQNNSYFSKYQDLICSDEWDEFEVIGNKFDEVGNNE